MKEEVGIILGNVRILKNMGLLNLREATGLLERKKDARTGCKERHRKRLNRKGIGKDRN